MEIRIETPKHGGNVDPLRIRISGTVFPGANTGAPRRLVAALGDAVVGETCLFTTRSSGDGGLAFDLLGMADAVFGRDDLAIEFRLELADGTRVDGPRVPVKFRAFDHRRQDFGHILLPRHTDVLHREHIYASGPPAAEPSPECVRLLHRYLGPAPQRVLDIGCGIGAYASPITEAGHTWHGVEVVPDHARVLESCGLPHTLTSGERLPFGDGEWDCAVAIEVLEHAADPDAFLAEAARVAPRLLVSVPNIEVLPYLHRWQVVPWHLLEADHKNFFTRWSLAAALRKHFARAEVLTYGEMHLRTPEGDPLHLHLFAIAEQ